MRLALEVTDTGSLPFLADMDRDGAALFSNGTQLQTLTVPSGSTLPHPALIDYADRQLASLYRGSDLSTMSQKGESWCGVARNKLFDSTSRSRHQSRSESDRRACAGDSARYA
jgi:hypothetical protein